MSERLNDIKKQIEAIKSTLISSAPQKNKDRRIMNIANITLEIIAEIEKEAKNGV